MKKLIGFAALALALSVSAHASSYNYAKQSIFCENTGQAGQVMLRLSKRDTNPTDYLVSRGLVGQPGNEGSDKILLDTAADIWSNRDNYDDSAAYLIGYTICMDSFH